MNDDESHATRLKHHDKLFSLSDFVGLKNKTAPTLFTHPYVRLSAHAKWVFSTVSEYTNEGKP